MHIRSFAGKCDFRGASTVDPPSPNTVISIRIHPIRSFMIHSVSGVQTQILHIRQERQGQPDGIGGCENSGWRKITCSTDHPVFQYGLSHSQRLQYFKHGAQDQFPVFGNVNVVWIRRRGQIPRVYTWSGSHVDKTYPLASLLFTPCTCNCRAATAGGDKTLY